MRKALSAAAAVLLVPAGPLAAHDLWADGDPVPGWVKAQCCGVADAHHLLSTDVHVTADGYRVTGYKRAIPQDKRLPSPDGNWWVFYRDYTDGSQSPVFCFFGPDDGS